MHSSILKAHEQYSLALGWELQDLYPFLTQSSPYNLGKLPSQLCFLICRRDSNIVVP